MAYRHRMRMLRLSERSKGRYGLTPRSAADEHTPVHVLRRVGGCCDLLNERMSFSSLCGAPLSSLFGDGDVGGRNSIQTTLGLSWLWTIFCLSNFALREYIPCSVFFDLVIGTVQRSSSRCNYICSTCFEYIIFRAFLCPPSSSESIDISLDDVHPPCNSQLRVA
jgi:hypothetical protein